MKKSIFEVAKETDGESTNAANCKDKNGCGRYAKDRH